MILYRCSHGKDVAGMTGTELNIFLTLSIEMMHKHRRRVENVAARMMKLI
jgi:hypothetical protein